MTAEPVESRSHRLRPANPEPRRPAAARTGAGATTRRGRRRAWLVLPLLLLLPSACGGGGGGAADAGAELRALADSTLSRLEGEIRLQGLDAPVEVLRDPWGVAHIYAETEHDLFMAQGFVAAQDRLWQMEWWRRFGEGTLAEILGPVAVPHDRFARLLRYRGDPEAEYASYHPRGRAIIEAFVEGVNAYVERAGGNPPVEFQLAGIRPEPWTAGVPILRMAGLAMTGNNLREIDLALLVDEVGPEEANRRDAPDPWRELQVPDGLDLDAIPDDFRRRALGEELPAPALLPRFQELLGAPAAAAWEPQVRRRAARALLSSLYAALADPHGLAAGEGSNNWAVSGDLTATGKPMLANDPHRAITLPSLRYLVHLSGAGWDVIGAGEPALPGVAIGHNDRIAWGLTIVGIDQGDIFQERLNPEDPDQVWHRGRWEELRTVVETIEVAGEGPQELQLQFSHHGPVILKDPDAGYAYAFRTVLTEPGTAGYLGSLRVDQAADWEEYLQAMDAWKVPSENLVYADVDGNIGWMAAGLTPRRDGWTGRLPVPGDGDHEWDGFRPTMELPHEYNPERGWITTANHNIMPAGYEPPLGYRWTPPHRYRRLAEVLGSGDDFTVEDFQGLQHDVLSRVALQRLEVLREGSLEDPELERARELLLAWDGRVSVDSADAALYGAWRREVDASAEPAAGEEAFADRERAVEALEAAVRRLESEQGEDWREWRWGEMNRLRLEHPLVKTFGVGEVPRPGDPTTVNVGYPGHGASFREIIDLADWDRSVATSAPGQSGQPGSPHYDDLLPMWQRGEYFPLLYSRAAVERRAEHRLRLLPAEGR